MGADADHGLTVHMIGSLPLPDAETAFRTVGGALGAHMRCLPDGETGRRTRWISFINDQLKAHPDLEIDPTVPPFDFTQWDGKVVLYGRTPARPRRGRPGGPDLRHGYADDAIRNYGIFARLKAEGRDPGLRQVPDLHGAAVGDRVQLHVAQRL